MNKATFVYCPVNGPRWISKVPSIDSSLAFVIWENNSTHIFPKQGDILVHVMFDSEPSTCWFRNIGRDVAEKIASAYNGISWDEKGMLHVAVPFDERVKYCDAVDIVVRQISDTLRGYGVDINKNEITVPNAHKLGSAINELGIVKDTRNEPKNPVQLYVGMNDEKISLSTVDFGVENELESHSRESVDEGYIAVVPNRADWGVPKFIGCFPDAQIEGAHIIVASTASEGIENVHEVVKQDSTDIVEEVEPICF